MDDRIWGRIALSIALISMLIAAGMAYLYLTSDVDGELSNIIGVIDVDGTITSYEDVSVLSSAINKAIHDSTVKGVVLRINSPGGVSHLIEEVYLDFLVLKNMKPLVVSTSMALSGGYYLAVAAQEIYASGTAMVGNVGVVGSAPRVLIPNESEYETGPQKATGFSRLLFPYNLSHALNSFVGAIYEGRGEILNITADELKSGKIWLGSEALSIGLVDGIGGLQVALSRAAKLAGIKVYEIENLSPNGLSIAEDDWKGLGQLSIDRLNMANPPPAIYYLYLPLGAYDSQTGVNETIPSENATGTFGGVGQVLVDLSHGNKVSPWTFDMLQAQLSGRGVTLSYSDDWGDIEEALDASSCLIIAAPTRHYNF
ncbi:MAG: S49 family peptidase [Candidatus Bathyarchaeia archaeon]